MKNWIMNDKQKKCLWASIALIVAMGLFPPWVVESREQINIRREYRYTTESGPYSWIGDPPSRAKFVDLYRLGIQYFVVAVVTAGLISTFRDKKDRMQ